MLIAGCTGRHIPVTTQANRSHTAATTLATTVMTTAMTTAPNPQVEATLLNQTNVSITIKNFAFSQPFIIVSKGTTVTWTNQDTTQHQIINNPTIIPGMGNIYTAVFSE